MIIKITFFYLSNFSSLTHINLGFNGLDQILDNTFGNYPNLENFNLSHNNINSLGNNLGLLNNPDTEIDLSSNNIEYLLGRFSFYTSSATCLTSLQLQQYMIFSTRE